MSFLKLHCGISILSLKTLSSELSPDQTQVWFSGGDWLGRAWQAYSPANGTLTAPDGGSPWTHRVLSPGDTRPLCGP